MSNVSSNSAEGVSISLEQCKQDNDWRSLFSSFSHIVLVANSDGVDAEQLLQAYPASTLFVFFNKVYKVLHKPFHGKSVLVSRGSEKGANIVYRREVGKVLKFFPKENFLGILNVKADSAEKFNTAADFDNAPTGHLDLTGFCGDFYTEGKIPTSGFALALWLSGLNLQARLVLVGFSARRSDRWKVVSVHDWTLEQVFLRLFERLGKISIHDGVNKNPYAALLHRFPDIPASEIALAASDVLSERLGNANAEIDKLISLTNIIRKSDQLFRKLRPKLFKR